MTKFKTLITLALTLALCLGALAPAASASESYVPNAAITKILQAPVGTTLPGKMDFVFEIKPVKWDNEVSNGTNMPSFDDIKISYNANMIKPSANATAAGVKNPYTADGITYYILESGNIFDSLKGTWKGAGKYEYTITEKPGTFTINATGSNNNFTEGMTWSKASYTMYVYVMENATGAFYIDGIGVLKVKNDNGTGESEKKITVVTPGGDDKDYFWSKIEFRNSYWKISNGDPGNPNLNDASLTVSKTIDGAALVKPDYDRYFKFTLTVTLPSVIPAADLPAHYCAFVVDADGKIITNLTANALNAATADIGNNTKQDYIKFVPGKATSFNLKQGEKLVFVDTPVGTAYKASEGATPYFMPSYIITTAGIAAGVVTGYTSQSITTGTEYTGEGKGMLNNLAAFKNTCNSTPETGLANLPIYGLSLLAIIALVIFILLESRKNKDNYREN